MRRAIYGLAVDSRWKASVLMLLGVAGVSLGLKEGEGEDSISADT